MQTRFCRHLVGKILKIVCTWNRCNGFVGKLMIIWTLSLTELIEFYSNNRINIRPLTPHIMPCNTHKMAIVSLSQIVWRHFTLCTYVSLPRYGSRVLWLAYLSVCLCVFACLESYLRNCTSDLHQFFAHVTYGRGSVLLWRHNDTLCISGFMDDVIFARKPRLLDVAAQLKRSAYAALGLAINCAH